MLFFDRPSISFHARMHTVPEAKPSYGRMQDTVKAEKIVRCSLYSYAFPVPVSTARHAQYTISDCMFWSSESALKLKVHLYSIVFGQARKADHVRDTDRSYSNATYSSRSHISISCRLDWHVYDALACIRKKRIQYFSNIFSWTARFGMILGGGWVRWIVSNNSVIHMFPSGNTFPFLAVSSVPVHTNFDVTDTMFW